MLLLSYSLVIESTDKEKFESFLRNDFHPFLLITLGFSNFNILKLNTEAASETNTFIIQFYFTKNEEIVLFREEFQETIMNYISAKTLLQFYYFDSILESIE